MTVPATTLGTAIANAMFPTPPGPPVATVNKHIAWAQAFLDNYSSSAGHSNVFTGTTVPDPSLGANGDIYFRIDTGIVDLYGPKAAGLWGAAKSLLSAVPSHNDTTNKQGGTTGEYYHLTAAELAKLTAFPNKITVSDTEPVTPTTGDLWVDIS